MKLSDTLAVLAVILIWGMNFIAIKVSVGLAPPLFVSTIRFAIASAVLVFWVPFPHGQIKNILILSLIMGGFHFSMLFVGMRGIDVAVAAIITQLGVPFSALIARVFLKDMFGWRRGLGMFIAFAGVAILAGEPKTVTLIGPLMLVLGSTVAWGAGNVWTKHMGTVKPLSLIAWLSLFSTPLVFMSSLVFETGQMDVLFTLGIDFWLAVSYAAICSSVIGYGIWYHMVQKYDVTTIVPFNLMTPVIAVMAGILVLGEEASFEKLAGGAITLFGVAVIQLRWRRPSQPQG